MCCTYFQEDGMYELQKKEWDPVIEWFCKRFQVNLRPTRELGGSLVPVEAKEIIRKHLLSYDLSSMHGNKWIYVMYKLSPEKGKKLV